MTETIWFTTPDPAALNALHEDCAVAHVGIEITAFGPDWLEGTVPVDARTRQPFGRMHGGAAALLLETLASAAGNHCVDPAAFMTVGVDLNCTHLRAVREGLVTGRATALHLGRATQVWGLSASDARGRPVTAGRLTARVVPVESPQ